MLKAVIWDMDGVLIDTEPLFEEYLRQALLKKGHEMTDELLQSVRGTTSHHFWETMKKEFQLVEEVAHLVRTYREEALSFWDQQTQLEPNPGVRELIIALRKEGIPQAVASSGYLKRSKSRGHESGGL